MRPTHTIFGSAEVSKVLFKTFHSWPADESCRLQGFLENGHEFLFKLNMRSDEIK